MNVDLCIAQVLAHPLSRDSLVGTVENISREPVSRELIMNSLTRSSSEIVRRIIDSDLPRPVFRENWKSDLSNSVCNVLDVEKLAAELVRNLLDVLGENRTSEREVLIKGFGECGLMRVASSIGCIAVMVKYGLDPDLLQMTNKEHDCLLEEMSEQMSQTAPENVFECDLSPESRKEISAAITKDRTLH